VAAEQETAGGCDGTANGESSLMGTDSWPAALATLAYRTLTAVVQLSARAGRELTVPRVWLRDIWYLLYY
jgi:hypothetical protein